MATTNNTSNVSRKKLKIELDSIESNFAKYTVGTADFNKYTRSDEVHNALLDADHFLINDTSINKQVRNYARESLTLLLRTDRAQYGRLNIKEYISTINKIAQNVYDSNDMTRLKKLTSEIYEINSSKDSFNQGTTSGYVGKAKKDKGYQYNYNSYAGADMVCTIDVPGEKPLILGELSELSYSIFRSKTPVRALGTIRAKGFTRGMRIISGILTFSVFDQSIPAIVMKKMNKAGYDILMDEIPLFDITVSMANEYGSRSKFVIYGVTTTTQGMVTGVNDIYLQTAYQFYALDISDIKKVGQY